MLAKKRNIVWTAERHRRKCDELPTLSHCIQFHACRSRQNRLPHSSALWEEMNSSVDSNGRICGFFDHCSALVLCGIKRAGFFVVGINVRMGEAARPPVRVYFLTRGGINRWAESAR
jgi:hypothetical protein